MNAYSQGVADALGVPVAVGALKTLFHPSNYRHRVDSKYIQRRLSTWQVAELLMIDPSTVSRYRQLGWLTGKKSGHRRGWRKYTFWRYSLKDVEECLLVRHTRKHPDNPIEHTTWTPQEIELLQHGIVPEGRSSQACRNQRHRIKRKKNNASHYAPSNSHYATE